MTPSYLVYSDKLMRTHHHDSEKARVEAGKATITYGADGWPVGTEVG